MAPSTASRIAASTSPWKSVGCDDDMLVPGHRRIDRLRPGVDAAREVEHLLEPLLQEVLGRALAAPAVVAMEDQRRVPIERHQRGLVERAGGGDGGLAALGGGPHVDQPERLAGV